MSLCVCGLAFISSVLSAQSADEVHVGSGHSGDDSRPVVTASRRMPVRELGVVFVEPAPLVAPRTEVVRPLPVGPDALPSQLRGVWKVSVCAHTRHAWIRFANVDTAEIHTLSRTMAGFGGERDPKTGHWTIPPVETAGVQWDRELDLEDAIGAGKHILVGVLVRDPQVFRGKDDGRGYHKVRNNCARFARDAWQFYSGERYVFAGLCLPEDLAFNIWKRHPEVPLAARLNYPR